MESKISFFPQEIVIAPLEYCFQSQNPDELREGAEGWWAGGLAGGRTCTSSPHSEGSEGLSAHAEAAGWRQPWWHSSLLCTGQSWQWARRRRIASNVQALILEDMEVLSAWSSKQRRVAIPGLL